MRLAMNVKGYGLGMAGGMHSLLVHGPKHSLVVLQN